MAMTKLIYNDSLNQGGSVEFGMRLVEDPKAFTKQASEASKSNTVMPNKDHVGIHILALGESERYGFNRNGDGFPKKACVDYHDTFVKNGHVYEHHQNKDPQKKLGDIIKSAYNKDMGRIELFIHAHKEKAAQHLEKLARDGEVAFSMACFTAGTPVLTRDRGYVAIESVTTADYVLTHKGNWRRVDQLQSKPAKDHIRISLGSYGRRTVEVTGNHELYVANFSNLKRAARKSTPCRGFRTKNRHLLYTTLSWVPASEVGFDHYMAVPILRQYDSPLSITDARLMGYYLADGSLTGWNGDKPVTVELTVNKKNIVLQEVEKLADWVSVTQVEKPNSDQALSVRCNSTKVAVRMLEEVGRASGKRVPLSVLTASKEAKLNFAATWFNSDGWQDKDGLHWSTSLDSRAIDLQRLLASLDIPSSCCRIDHPEDRGIIKSANAVEYVVNVSNTHSDKFVGLSKATVMPVKGASKLRTFISGDYLMVPITGIENVDKPAQVYNIAVEEDATYTVYGLAVHNCRVAEDRCSKCGQLRSSGKDPRQCKHIADSLGKTAEDGTYIGTYNDHPKFFDISFVYRPADRIAWNLSKAASAIGVDSIKLAEDAGLWTPPELLLADGASSEKFSLLKKLAGFEDKYRSIALSGPLTHEDLQLWELRKAAASTGLDNATIEELRRYEPEDVLPTLARNKIILDPESYCKYAMGADLGQLRNHLDEVKQACDGVFSRLLKEGRAYEVCSDSYYDFITPSIYVIPHVNTLATKIAMIKSATSLDDEHIKKRAIDLTIAGLNPEINVNSVGSARISGVAKVVSEKYASYKLASINAMRYFHPYESKDRQLAILAVQSMFK